MKDLNVGQSNECVSILRQFIEDSTLFAEKKRTAVLALEQLQRTKAGTGTGTVYYSDPKCNGRPRAD